MSKNKIGTSYFFNFRSVCKFRIHFHFWLCCWLFNAQGHTKFTTWFQYCIVNLMGKSFLFFFKAEFHLPHFITLYKWKNVLFSILKGLLYLIFCHKLAIKWIFYTYGRHEHHEMPNCQCQSSFILLQSRSKP